jgi:hypothetical protein
MLKGGNKGPSALAASIYRFSAEGMAQLTDATELQTCARGDAPQRAAPQFLMGKASPLTPFIRFLEL